MRLNSLGLTKEEMNELYSDEISTKIKNPSKKKSRKLTKRAIIKALYPEADLVLLYWNNLYHVASKRFIKRSEVNPETMTVVHHFTKQNITDRYRK